MPKYYVVRMEGREAIPIILGGEAVRNGEPFLYDYADVANQDARYMTEDTGIKHQVRTLAEDLDWTKRELERFESGHYTKLPWHGEPWVEHKPTECHFAHVSRDNPANIAYTPNKEYGVLDRKSILRPARYLAKYYASILSEDERRNLAGKYKALYDKDNTLKFAFDAQDIIRVYRRGPQSCMREPAKRSKVHPVAAYAGPDLAVAYLEKGGRIPARVLCWPKKHIYGRVYGDKELLTQLLEEEGWKHDHAGFEGARLTKIKEGKRYVCPFIDGIQRVMIGKKWLRITVKGKHTARNQDGFCGEGFRCACCGEEMLVGKAGNIINVHDIGHNYCGPCGEKSIADKSVFLCAISRRYYIAASGVKMHDGAMWYRPYAHSPDYAFRCLDCKERFPIKHPHVRQKTYDPYSGKYHIKCRECATKQADMFGEAK